ncbi:MAG: hypothetical protein WC960_03670 [Bacteroidales bacterium]
MKKILLLNTFILSLLLLFSCDSPGKLYDQTRGDEVSFPSKTLKYEMVAEDNNSFKIELYRGNSLGALTVPVIIDMTGDEFTPTDDKFIFADGENKAYLQFDYNSIDNFGGESYAITVTVADPDQLSISGVGEVKMSVSRKLTYKLYATGTFYSEIIEYGFDGPPSVSRELYKAEEGEYYRFPNLYEPGYHIEFSLDSQGKIQFDEQSIGIWYDAVDYPENGMFHWGTTFLDECVVDDGYYLFVVDFCLPEISYSFGDWWEVFEVESYANPN